MAGVEAESRELAWAVHNAVHAEYNYFIQEVRGFSQEEIICDTPDYFTGLARRLSDYLKNVEHTIDELEWRNALSDCLGCPDPTPGWGGNLQLGSDYFTFADKLEATLRGIGRRQVREAEEQATMINSLLIDSGWHHCLLDKKDESETDSWSDADEESGRDDDS